MNKRFWMAFAACWVVGQVIGFTAHGIWLQPTYKALAAIFRPEADMQGMMWMMFVSSALLVFAFCYIFTKGYEGKGIAEGVRYGLWIALLMGITTVIDQFVIYPIPAELAAKWAAINVAYFVALGAVLAAIYKPDAAKT